MKYKPDLRCLLFLFCLFVFCCVSPTIIMCIRCLRFYGVDNWTDYRETGMWHRNQECQPDVTSLMFSRDAVVPTFPSLCYLSHWGCVWEGFVQNVLPLIFVPSFKKKNLSLSEALTHQTPLYPLLFQGQTSLYWACWYSEGPTHPRTHCFSEGKCWNQLHHYVCLHPREEARSGFWQPEVAECVFTQMHVYVWSLPRSFYSRSWRGVGVFCSISDMCCILGGAFITLHKVIANFFIFVCMCAEVERWYVIHVIAVSQRCTSLQWKRFWSIVFLWRTEASPHRRRKGNTGRFCLVFTCCQSSSDILFIWSFHIWIFVT